MLAVNAGARAGRARAGAVRDLGGLALRRAQPAGQPGGAAADRRADRRGRGERLRRAAWSRRFAQEDAPADALHGTRSRACSTSRWSRPGCAPSTTRFIGFLPQLGLAAILLVGGRQAIDGHDQRRRVRRLLRLRADARSGRCGRSASRSGWRSAPWPRARGSSRSSTASRADARRTDAAAAARRRRARGAARRRRSPTTAASRCCADIDLDVEAGSTVALVGATGSGKTTLVSLVPRLYDPIAGQRADRRRRRARGGPGVAARARSRSSPTTRSCSPPSLRENIAYARPGRDRRGGRATAARRAGLARVHRASCPTATTRGSASAG